MDIKKNQMETGGNLGNYKNTCDEEEMGFNSNTGGTQNKIGRIKEGRIITKVKEEKRRGKKIEKKKQMESR